MARLDGRVAIVTGGARSIGAAFAKGLAAEGAKIVIADLDAAEETLGIIKQAGGEAMAVKTDVTNESSCEEMVAKAVEAYGKLDILVNNAGMVKVGNPENQTTDEYRLTMSVHVDSVFFGCRKAIPIMAASTTMARSSPWPRPGR